MVFKSEIINPTTAQGFFPTTTITDTSATLALSQAERFVICSNGSTQTITIPLNATVPFTVGTEIVFFQQGAGQVVFSATGGVTLQSSLTATKIATQYAVATLKKLATDTWVLFGNISS